MAALSIAMEPLVALASMANVMVVVPHDKQGFCAAQAATPDPRKPLHKPERTPPSALNCQRMIPQFT